jgi:hypothetical protein
VRRAGKAAPAWSEAGPRAVRSLVCAGAVGALLACGNQAPECHAERCAPTVIDVMTWWSNTGSSPGASLEEAAELQPGVNVNLGSMSSKDEMMTSLAEILDDPGQNEQVDAFLTHPGGDLLRWTPCGGEDRTRLRLLNGPDGYPDLSARFGPRVLQGLQCCASATGCESPQVYAVPLGLHQINHIISNKARLAQCAGVQVTTVDDFVELLGCLSENGPRVITVPVPDLDFQQCGIGAESTCWKSQDVAGQSLQYLLEGLFLLRAGPSAYEDYWSGRCWQQDSARAAALLSDVLEALDRVRPYLNNCPGEKCRTPPTDFGAALTEVSEGAAALVVAPDWNQFTKAGQSQTADKGPFPGTSGTFLFTTDSFALPALPGISAEAGLRWIDTLLQPQVQTRFADINGAHPALGDHSQLAPLLPSLEVLLPPGANLLPLRERLNAWAQGKFSGPPPALADIMDAVFRAAHGKGLLPAGVGDAAVCELP